MFKKLICALATSAVVVAAPGTQTKRDTPSVTLPQGVAQGTTTTLPSATSPVHKYLGIPFAQSPPPRFEPALPLEGESSEMIDATQWKHKCIQTSNGSTRNVDQEPDDDEDCLYVNVYAPENALEVGNKTVLVWIYGGALQTGNAGRSDYDGSSFAANQDIILVSFNYRLNVFGFSNAPSLDATQTNVGFHDQRLALDWIKNNIAAFGGDPAKITIMGESSGAASVDRLLLNPPEGTPFRAAIMQSGQASLSPLADDDGVSKWQNLVTEVGCATSNITDEQYACMKEVDATVIRDAVEKLSLSFFPVNDNVTQTATPLKDAIKDGKGAQVPLLMGTNTHEGSVFIQPYLENAIGDDGKLNTTQLTAVIEDFGVLPSGFTTLIKTFLDSLLLVSADHLLNSLSNLVTSLVFKCPASEIAHAHLDAGKTVYRYSFAPTYNDTQLDKVIPEIGIKNIGAYHAAEIPIVFGTYDTYQSVAPATDHEIQMSKFMQTAWANFAKDPTSENAPGWNPVNHWRINDIACLGCVENSTGLTTKSELEFDGDCLVLNNFYTASKPLF
ncbi:Carboxylesterase [Wallemia mellicola]|uniref:Carboxylic ester hydrolase n=1 Tax=Wallemia mellicola TaxID=1708541 RepID=A0A4T0PP65_9BASI|nr:Carboxylesterase [Wallemia mellicola]TIB83835.1 Carboxylesterase [Wallemia mellicola]TIC12796.1 Carboxylesterase [Wallemia mellicola]TIC22980.1 Carboxylesterase [Wallemia mellicola]TIC31512.1 Carboxylesterase [Wallemia mellicola]